MTVIKIIRNIVISALKNIRRRIKSIKIINIMNIEKKTTSEKLIGVRITTLLIIKVLIRRKLKRK